MLDQGYIHKQAKEVGADDNEVSMKQFIIQRDCSIRLLCRLLTMKIMGKEELGLVLGDPRKVLKCET